MSECSEIKESSDQRCSGYKHSRMETKICVVGRQNIENEDLMQAVKGLNLQILTSETGWDVFKDATDNEEIIFVCDPFEGEEFENLDKEDQRIIGPPIVYNCAKNKLPLPNNSRPLFCKILENHVICLTAFRVKEQVSRLVDLVHHMGGSVRKEMSGRVTHLVANGNKGTKYDSAVGLGKPIMADEWIFKCWERRHDLDTESVIKEMSKYTRRIFCGCCLTFYGFSDEDKEHMEETTEQQGGKFVPYERRDQCTHVVVADTTEELPTELIILLHMAAKNRPGEPATKYPKVVKQEWFWASNYVDACADESLYGFKNIIAEAHEPSGDDSNHETPNKRRKCEDGTASNTYSPLSISRKRKSIDALSPGSCAGTPGTNCSRISEGTPQEVFCNQDTSPSGIIHKTTTATSNKPTTARKQVAMELLQTESNYVIILETIVKDFKEQLKVELKDKQDEQDKKDKDGNPLPSSIIPPEHIKRIFGSFPDMLQLHTKIKEELDAIVSNWAEENCIGNVILAHADELTKIYPTFVNFFEMTKDTIAMCDRGFPRFHALLMKNLSNPACGRQTLQELMIRPVQRIPSIILLIKDLIKRTDTKNPDHKALSEALEVLKRVMTFINEDKRKTEGQVQMFEVLRDVDGCPADILTSTRFFVTKVDTFEMSDVMVGRGEAVTLFLFSDSLEVTKRRGLKQFPAKSPAAKTPQKAYKHVQFIHFKNIKKIVDIQDSEDFQNLFGIQYSYEKKENMKDTTVKEVVKESVFRLTADDVNKKDLIDKLLTNLTTVFCTVDKENYLTIKNPNEMGLSKSNTLSRAVRVARRTTRKVSRALSMNKTPKKLGYLRRAASTIAVPGENSPLGPSTRHNHEHAKVGGRPRVTSTPP